MAAQTIPIDPVEDDGALLKEKKPNRIMQVLSMLPFGDTLVSTTKQVVTILDSRIPTIRGRPAMSEIIANLKPGLTVSLVSLPLSISLAIAADATPVQGIITAAWAGLTSALFGGSHYNIVGPTGALSGILSEFSVRYGPGIQPLLAILAGIISLAVWLTRLDRFFVFIPSAVMHGFTLGVAFIIALNQLNFIFGLPKLPRHEGFLDNLWESLTHLYLANWFAVVFFVCSYGALFFLQRKYGKIPWGVVLAMIGIIIGAVQEAMGWSVQLATIKSRYGELEMSLVQAPDLFTKGINAGFSEWVHIIQGSFSIALVAVLETLISASIADRMTKTLYNQKQEVLAIALCNSISGLAGGIPATAALARTALNIKSGATSRAAGIVNGVMIIILSTVLFNAFKYLPLPVVAAILVNVAVRMVEWPEVRLLYKMDKSMFSVAVLSALVCIVEDPTMGIIVGALLGMIVMLLQMRTAHATLRLYSGSLCRLNYLFEGVDTARTTTACKKKYTETEKDVALIADAQRDPSAALVKYAPASATAAVAASLSPDGVVVRKPKMTRRERRLARRAAALASGRDLTSLEADLYHVDPEPRDTGLPLVAVYKLPGYFTYVAALAHRERLRVLFTHGSEDAAALVDARVVVFSLEDTYYADPDALETVGTMVDEIKRSGKEVALLGFHAKVLQPISKTHFWHEVRHYPEYVDLLLAMRECVDPATGKYVAPPPPSHDHDDHGHGSAAAPAPALAIEAPASAGAAAAPAAAAQPSAAGTGIAASAGHHPVGGRAHTVIPAGGSAAGAAAGAPGAAAAAPGGSTNWASF